MILPHIIQQALPPTKPELVEENPQHPDDNIDFQKPIPIHKKDEEETSEEIEKKAN